MITHYAEVSDKIAEIDGLISFDESHYLFNLTKISPQDAVIVEIGSHTGKSSISMGVACLDTSRKLYCIDLWGNGLFFSQWKDNIKKFGLEKQVIPIQGWSGDILSRWGTDVGLMIDLIFIDGSHGLSDVTKDFVLAYPWIKCGGVIAFHDVGHPSYPGTVQTWEVFKSILSNQVQVGSICSGRKILIK